MGVVSGKEDLKRLNELSDGEIVGEVRPKLGLI
jgi:hypothetical protein